MTAILGMLFLLNVTLQLPSRREAESSLGKSGIFQRTLIVSYLAAEKSLPHCGPTLEVLSVQLLTPSCYAQRVQKCKLGSAIIDRTALKDFIRLEGLLYLSCEKTNASISSLINTTLSTKKI